jgi:hypothetical protein
VSWRLAREILFVIVGVVAWGRFVWVVMTIAVNVGAVMGASISVDVTNMTVPS